MYRVTRRESLIPFLFIVFLGVLASYFVPQFFPSSHLELPLFALFPGEIAIALIFSVLLFENASPTDLIKLAAMMICVAMLDGAFCNIVGKGTTILPDLTLQLNAVQLLVWNVTGIAAIVALFTTVSEDQLTGARERQEREAAGKETVTPKSDTEPSKIDFTPATAATAAAAQEPERQESAKDILGSLDVDRINKLEQTLATTSQPDKVSLETLFADETKAAERVKKDEPEPIAQVAQTPEPEPVVHQMPAEQAKPVEPTPEPVAETKGGEGGGLLQDVSGDLEDIFADLAPADAQKDFSPAEKEKAAEPEPAATAPAAGLVNVSDSDMDDIFGGLLGGEEEGKPAAAEPVAEAPEPTPQEPAPQAPAEAQPAMGPKLSEAGSQAAAAVKEFGKLSAAAVQKPAAAGGTLKTIGQMLLDSSAVERIIKQAETAEGGSKWRVLTVDRGANLQAMMDRMAKFPGVEGAILIGKDGLLLANTESLSALKYVLGPLSLAIHSTTNLGTSKLALGDLRQCVLKSGDNVSVIVDAGSGLLGVFGKYDLNRINQLFDHIIGTASGETVELPTTDEVTEEQATAAPTPEPAAAAAAGGPISVSDSDMDDIFGGVLAEGTPDKKPEPAAAPAAGGPISVSDSDMDDIFGGVLAEGKDASPKADAQPAAAEKAEEKAAEPVAEKPAEPVAEKPVDKKKKEPAKPATQIKEFGKLSAQALSKQQPGQETGSMKAIGKQLIDVQAVENIIKAGEKRDKIGSGLTTARVISAARGEGIKTLLSKIDSYEGVMGSLIVGHDGLVIASTLKSSIDKDMMGALCTAIHSHTDVTAKKLDKGKLQQLVFYANGGDNDKKVTILTGVAVGILAVFVDEAELARLDGLLQAIETTVRG